MRSIRTALFVTAALIAVPAGAQETIPAQPESEAEAEPGSDDFHNSIVVTAAGLDRLDLLAGTSVVDGVELQRNMDGQVGEVLAHLPGVSASGFAPGVSRPILRGFGGERVRVLTDGVGAIDASSASDDHAVTVEPLIAERIEVLRGPAVLLYGSQAIGGAVNVVTKRIPHAVPEEPVHVDALLGLDSAANRVEGGASVDLPLGPNVAFHLDGSWRDSDDLAIPGFVASDRLRAELREMAAEEVEEGHLDEAGELREAVRARNVLPNSWTRTWTLGTGIAFHSGANNLGVSFDFFDTSYGIPGLPGVGHVHAHEEEEEYEEEDHEEDGEEHGDEEVSIAMKRYRAELRGALDLGAGFFDRLQTRWGYSDYTHTEFEGDEVGTVFDVAGIEGRVELVQNRRGNWGGQIGAQFSHVDFAAEGEEAFIAANRTDSLAIFAVQEVDLDPVEIEFGARYENTAIDASRSTGFERGFDSFSASAGASYALVAQTLDDLRIGANFSRAERSPSAQALIADGPHVATQQFELGNAALSTEKSWGAEAYLRGNLGRTRLSASVYRNWFTGFIYLQGTGAQEDGLPVFSFLQQDARQFGVEGEIAFPLYEANGFALLADLRGDYVRATLADGNPVPRIPPLSATGAVEGQFGHFDARAEVEHFARQDRVAPREEPTDGYTFVNLSLAWHPVEGADNITIIAQADNIFDVEGRRHTSYTKDFVPLAGRNFRLTARASF